MPTVAVFIAAPDSSKCIYITMCLRDQEAELSTFHAIAASGSAGPPTPTAAN